MKTDGGSIPRIFRASSQYSPWRFTPAFMIHDWMFHMKHCGDPEGQNDTVKTAADVMAECVKTQMEQDPKVRNPLTLLLMDIAVRNFAGKLWDDGHCDKVELPQEEMAYKIIELAKSPQHRVDAGPAIFSSMPPTEQEVQYVRVPAEQFLGARLSPATAPVRVQEFMAAGQDRVLVPVIHVMP
jgi:hypothetical protein